MTEKEIQNYIWDKRNEWKSLLEKPGFPSTENIDNPSFLSPADAMFNLAIKKTKALYDSVEYLELFGCEVPLKKEGNSTIRADLLGINGGGNGLTVIEIKKSEQTERQAFTELLAYAGHLRTTFAPMSKMDILYVLIAPMKERIVREAVVNCLLYENIRIIALIPKWENEDIKTLKLNPWVPSFDEIKQLSSNCFSESNFEVFKVAWEALDGDWYPVEGERDPDNFIIKRMNTLTAYAAQEMEAKGIHGFVFTTQSYTETREFLPLPNGLVLCGINPYKATKNRILSAKHPKLTDKEIDNIEVEEINLLDIIPELKNTAKQDNTKHNFLGSLSMTWNNEITGIGFSIVNILTKNLGSDYIMTDHGSFDWDQYQDSFNEDVYCHNFDIRVTGLFRELFFEYAKQDYDYIRKNGNEDHFQYSYNDIPNYLVDISISQTFVRNFIKRLFNPFYEFDDGYSQD